MADSFEHPRYLIRRQVLKLFGGAFGVYDPHGKLVLYADLKAFRLKEDIRVYGDEEGQRELLTIKARQILWATSSPHVPTALDAEKIIVTGRDKDSRKMKVLCAGDLHEEEIRDELLRTMEGGPRSFARRRDLYSM